MKTSVIRLGKGVGIYLHTLDMTDELNYTCITNDTLKMKRNVCKYVQVTNVYVKRVLMT